jgi:hypothetical protein
VAEIRTLEENRRGAPVSRMTTSATTRTRRLSMTDSFHATHLGRVSLVFAAVELIDDWSGSIDMLL